MTAIPAAGLGALLMMRSSSVSALTFAGAPLRKFALGLLPCLFAGAVMTLLLWLQANLQSIPGVWLLLYGCALVSASAATNRMVGVMGGAFVAFGLLALASPPSVQLILLGAGFGPLHVIFGILIGRNPHDG